MTDAKQCCAGCQFASAFPKPGPEPVKPDRPDNWWARLFWSDPANDIWSPYRWAMIEHLTARNKHENLARCQRFPEQQTVRKTYWCGEFDPALPESPAK